MFLFGLLVPPPNLDYSAQNPIRLQNSYLNALLPHEKKRYSKTDKMVAARILIKGGPSNYREQALNTGLPSEKTVKRFLDDQNFFTEGKIHAKELRQFLNSRGLPSEVFYAEDATRVLEEVLYDCHSKRFVGAVMELDPKTGFPIESIISLKEATKRPKANNIIACVAKSYSVGSPSFILAAFGSRNVFKATDVFNRFKYISECLQKEGILLIG